MINNNNLWYKNIDRVLDSNNNFEKLRNKTVLITGVNGMIASAINDIIFVLNKKYNYNTKVLGLMRSKKRELPRFKEYIFYTGIEQDVLDSIKIEQKVDYIIHAASNADPKSFSEYPVDTMMANIFGLKNMLDLARKNEAERILFVSSGEIYGQGSNDIMSFSEEYLGKLTILNSRSCYPISKIASETLCTAYYEQYGVDCVIARPCHTYGPTQSEKDSRAASQFIRDVVNGKDIVMKSEGKQVRSYCNVLDCASGILTILCKGTNCNAYNVANNKSIVSIRDFAEKLVKLGNSQLLFEIPNEKEKKSYNPVTRSVLDGSKLESIGWKPIYDIDEGIKMTLEIMKEKKC